jgi:hypothetical protein
VAFIDSLPGASEIAGMQNRIKMRYGMREQLSPGSMNANALKASTILARPLFRGFFASDRRPEPDQEEQKKVRRNLPWLSPV